MFFFGILFLIFGAAVYFFLSSTVGLVLLIPSALLVAFGAMTQADRRAHERPEPGEGERPREPS